MWSVNLKHYLDEKGSTDQVPVEAKALAEHFGRIVSVVTLDYTGQLVEIPEISCRNPELKGCPGTIIGYLGEELEQVKWYCNECNGSGVVTGWEDTLWGCMEIALNDL